MVWVSPLLSLIFHKTWSFSVSTVILLPLPPMSAPKKKEIASNLHSLIQEEQPQHSFGYLINAFLSSPNLIKLPGQTVKHFLHHLVLLNLDI
jgi:hypothetical protein